jgi:hypothetical protein
MSILAAFMTGRFVCAGCLALFSFVLVGLTAAFAALDRMEDETHTITDAEARDRTPPTTIETTKANESKEAPFQESQAVYKEHAGDHPPHNWADDAIVILKENELHLDKALRLPPWLHLGLHQRTRYEGFNEPFQKGQTSGEHIVALQTLPSIGVRYDPFRFFVEGIDARVFGSSDRSVRTNTTVDEMDFLQLYGGLGTSNFLGLGVAAELTVGRQTFDFGSRRQIARNQFRNTINAFDGVHGSLGDEKTWQFRTFVVRPVQRLTVKPDAEAQTLFWGFFLGERQFKWFQSDLYVYVIEDEDRPGAVPGLKRSLRVPGFRVFKDPAMGEFDYEGETIWQVGQSALAPGGAALPTFAYFEHIQAGYTFNLPWSPNLILKYSYASGNRDPNGNEIGRFNPLFGVTTFELDPAGIFQVFTRSNISSPGWKLIMQPSDSVRVSFQHRMFWLAQSRDQWVNTGLQDPTGRAGNFLGHFLEWRGRWFASSNMTLESGWCYLIKGSFTSNLLAAGAPGTPNDKNATYVYVQLALDF